MDLEFIERLLEMFGQAPLAELELAEDGWRIRLTKAATPSRDVEVPATPTDRVQPARPAIPDDTAQPHLVVAGLVGTFYRRPAPDKPAFVAVGDLVEEGQTLGILEAMKTLIGIEADRAGRIAEIFKEDGTPVRLGDALFAIVPAEHP